MKKSQRFIKRINQICGIIGGATFLGELTFVLLWCIGFISNIALIIGMAGFALCFWIVIGIKCFAERKLINEVKTWAQKVVDTNYYCGKRITVYCRNGVWFSGPDDRWFVKKFKAHCKEVFQNTGMKVYYNYSWIML